MMSKSLVRVALALVVTAVTAAAAQASPIVVNLNATQSPPAPNNPVGVLLNAGTYDVTAVGIAGGGAYDAWNPWGIVGGCDGNGANCTVGGWVTLFYYQTNAGASNVWDGVIYATPTLALANTASAQFTILTAQTVYFGINDFPYSDNLGGVSVLVSEVNAAPAEVPEPATLALVGAGLAGLRRLRAKARS